MPTVQSGLPGRALGLLGRRLPMYIRHMLLPHARSEELESAFRPLAERWLGPSYFKLAWDPRIRRRARFESGGDKAL